MSRNCRNPRSQLNTRNALVEALADVLEQHRMTTIGGKRKSVPLLEIYIRRLCADVETGDGAATVQIMRRLDQVDAVFARERRERENEKNLAEEIMESALSFQRQVEQDNALKKSSAAIKGRVIPRRKAEIQ